MGKVPARSAPGGARGRRVVSLSPRGGGWAYLYNLVFFGVFWCFFFLEIFWLIHVTHPYM